MSDETEPAARPAPRSRWSDKLERRRERHLQHGRLYRLMFIIAGVIVTLTGIAMLVLPGPALLVIPIGLAMLAMEFAWAEEVLERALERADKAQKVAQEASTMRKVFTGVATLLAVAAVVAWGLIGDIPVIPDP